MRPATSISALAATAFLLIASFPSYHFYPLAWIALVPLFYAVSGSRGRIEAFCRVYICFLLFFLFDLHWLSVFGWYAWGAAAVVSALYPAFWGWIAFPALSRETFSFFSLLFIPVSYTGMEAVRGLGPIGMPWGDLAYTQWRWTAIIQSAGLFGAAGLSFLIATVNALVYWGTRGRVFPRFVPFASAVFLVFLFSLYGQWRLKKTFHPDFSVALVQTDDLQTVKWDRSQYETMLKEMNDLVMRAVPFHPDLTVFPETALAGYLDEDAELGRLVGWWAFNLGKPMLIGTLERIGSRPANALVLVNRDGVQSQSYAKVKLVPFGEYLPWPFRSLRGRWHALDPIVDFVEGKKFTLFHVNHASCGAVICFESSFGWLARKFANEGAEFLAVSTNDAWFYGTPAQQMHAIMAVFRAVETGRSVVQCGNTGISCMVDPRGRILAWQPAKTRGMLFGRIPLETETTLYDRVGDLFGYACIGLTLLGILIRDTPQYLHFVNRVCP